MSVTWREESKPREAGWTQGKTLIILSGFSAGLCLSGEPVAHHRVVLQWHVLALAYASIIKNNKTNPPQN